MCDPKPYESQCNDCGDWLILGEVFEQVLEFRVCKQCFEESYKDYSKCERCEECYITSKSMLNNLCPDCAEVGE